MGLLGFVCGGSDMLNRRLPFCQPWTMVVVSMTCKLQFRCWVGNPRFSFGLVEMTVSWSDTCPKFWCSSGAFTCLSSSPLHRRSTLSKEQLWATTVLLGLGGFSLSLSFSGGGTEACKALVFPRVGYSGRDSDPSLLVDHCSGTRFIV